MRRLIRDCWKTCLWKNSPSLFWHPRVLAQSHTAQRRVYTHKSYKSNWIPQQSSLICLFEICDEFAVFSSPNTNPIHTYLSMLRVELFLSRIGHMPVEVCMCVYACVCVQAKSSDRDRLGVWEGQIALQPTSTHSLSEIKRNIHTRTHTLYCSL